MIIILCTSNKKRNASIKHERQYTKISYFIWDNIHLYNKNVDIKFSVQDTFVE